MIGPNGAGKSTLPETVPGILRPSPGTITLAGLVRLSAEAAPLAQRPVLGDIFLGLAASAGP